MTVSAPRQLAQSTCVSWRNLICIFLVLQKKRLASSQTPELWTQKRGCCCKAVRERLTMALKYTNAFSFVSGSSSSGPTSKPVNLEPADDKQTRNVFKEDKYWAHDTGGRSLKQGATNHATQCDFRKYQVQDTGKQSMASQGTQAQKCPNHATPQEFPRCFRKYRRRKNRLRSSKGLKSIRTRGDKKRSADRSTGISSGSTYVPPGS